jgi:hypothetical protein
MIHVIAYDLHNPTRDYKDVIATVKSADSWAKIEESVWLIDTLLTTSTWRDKLVKAGDANDTHFVARLMKDAAWKNLPEGVPEWINHSARRW